jgi:hypothetical protein
MKKTLIASLAVAGIAATVGLAPAAVADMIVVQSPGNASATATPGESALQAGRLQYPWHHELGGHH